MSQVVAITRNGVNTEQLYGTLDAINQNPSLGTFRFRARNTWIDGAHDRSATEAQANPAEYLLHALAACLTTSLVYVATARKVRLTEVESTLEGDMDVRGALGLDDDYRNGFERIRVSFRIQGEGPPEKLREIASRASRRSAVYDMVTNGVPVAIEVETP